MAREAKKQFPPQSSKLFERGKLGLTVALFISFCAVTLSLSAHNEDDPKSRSMEERRASGGDRLGIVSDTVVHRPFPLPKLPLVIKTPRERALYYAAHYWDNCDFSPSNDYLQDSKAMERCFVDFLGIVLSLPLEEIKDYITIPAQKSHGELFKFFEGMYRKHLYESDSSLKNEEYYLPVIEWYSTSPKTDFATSERIKLLLKLVKSNRPGTDANNFSFVLADGEVRRLSDFRGKMTILFFFTPGCSGCQKASRLIAADEKISMRVIDNSINLLYICTENDVEGFRRGLSEIPTFATAGVNANGTVQNVPLYDLKESPTIFLLDKEGKVVLRDANIEDIRNYITKYLKITKEETILNQQHRSNGMR